MASSGAKTPRTPADSPRDANTHIEAEKRKTDQRKGEAVNKSVLGSEEAKSKE